MKKVKHDLLTSKYTEIRHEENFKFNAPHRFKVYSKETLNPFEKPPILADIHFQEGPIKEVGINGITNEDLIAMVICRLEHFQKSEFKCRDNALAITKLEEALLWLRKRTINRENRNVEKTNKK